MNGIVQTWRQQQSLDRAQSHGQGSSLAPSIQICPAALPMSHFHSVDFLSLSYLSSFPIFPIRFLSFNISRCVLLLNSMSNSFGHSVKYVSNSNSGLGPGIVTWHRSGHPTCLYFEEKKMAENEVSRIGILGQKWP